MCCTGFVSFFFVMVVSPGQNLEPQECMFVVGTVVENNSFMLAQTCCWRRESILGDMFATLEERIQKKRGCLLKGWKMAQRHRT
jgi:hypothetical protein